MPTFTATGKGYGALWDKAQIKDARRDELEQIARKAVANKERYVSVQTKTGCPWYVIAAIHMREGSMNFGTHLHEGSPLSGRTRNIPKGRPKSGNPPFTWEASASDALTVAPHDMRIVGRWSVERTLYELEKYNGWGYMGKVNSPYVWAGTSIYTSGKYVRDGVYDPTHIDRQQGTAAIIKAIAEKDSGVAARLKDREASPPKDLIDEEKKAASKTGKATVGAGAGTGAATGADASVLGTLPEWAIMGGIGIAAAVITIGIVLWIKSHRDTENMIKGLWQGEEVPA